MSENKRIGKTPPSQLDSRLHGKEDIEEFRVEFNGFAILGQTGQRTTIKEQENEEIVNNI